MEPNSINSKHPGRARFVLVDDGEPAREGSDQFPFFVIGISAFIAESAPVDYSFSYNNHNQNEFGEIGYGRCRGVSGRFAQQNPTTYRFEEGRNPQVEDLAFVETSQGCGDMPALTPANIFDGTVELEYGDTNITVISEDGERWGFQQIPIRSARQRAIDASPTTVAEATTTTTTEVERTDSVAERVSPCDPGDPSDGAPLGATLDKTTDWWEVLSADDAPLALLEAEDGGGSLSSSQVKVETIGITGERATNGSIDEIWFGIWHAGAIRVGLETEDAKVLVATDQSGLALITMLRFDDGSAMFGGICGTERYMRVLTASDEAGTRRNLDDITNHVGENLTDTLGF